MKPPQKNKLKDKQMNEENLMKIIALCSSKYLRGKALKQLVLKTGSFLNVMSLSDAYLRSWLCYFKKPFEGKGELFKKAEKIYTECKQKQIHILPITDKQYPVRLRQIYSPPLLLYYKGQLHKSLVSMDKRVVAIIGSRSIVDELKETTFEWSSYLTQKGLHVLSGMALGTDAIAQWGALKHGTTTAILGGGVDVIYPYGNAPLYRELLEQGGGVISEHPPGTRPLAYHFPMRNRIISGLSDTIILMQSGVKGGGMITATYAIEDNRDLIVYSNNGDLEHFSGNQRLIEQGAPCVRTLHDLAEVFGFLEQHKVSAPEITPVEEKIIKHLSVNELISLVDLSKKVLLTTDKLAAVLLQMIFKGIVGESPGKHYYKKDLYNHL